MPSTYEPIATTTLGSAAASITFSSISSAYTDLRLVFTCTTSQTYLAAIRFNSDTAGNYSFTYLAGNGSAASSGNGTSNTSIPFVPLGNTRTVNPTFVTVDIFSYAGSKNKTSLITTSGDNNGSGTVERIVGLWRNTSAINSLTITTTDTPTFSIGTTATLYGILKA